MAWWRQQSSPRSSRRRRLPVSDAARSVTGACFYNRLCAYSGAGIGRVCPRWVNHIVLVTDDFRSTPTTGHSQARRHVSKVPDPDVRPTNLDALIDSKEISARFEPETVPSAEGRLNGFFNPVFPGIIRGSAKSRSFPRMPHRG